MTRISLSLLLLTVIVVAVAFFHTSPIVTAGAAIYGVFKSFGITISILAAMLMIFLMREVGALESEIMRSHVPPVLGITSSRAQ